MDHRPWRVAGITGGALLLPVMLLPPGPALKLLWLTIAAATFVATRVGLRLHPPVRPGGLGFLSASMGSLTLAAVLDLPWWPTIAAGALATLASLLYVGAFMLIAIAMMRLAAVRMPGGDPEGLIDTALVGIATVAVLYDVLSRTATAADVSLLASVTVVLLPLLLAPVLAASVRLLITGTHRYVAAWCFFASSLAGLVGNVWFIVDPVSSRVELRPLWLAAYVTVACGALHPTSARLSEPAPTSGAPFSFGRLTVIGLALAALPAILLRSAAGGSRVPAVAAILSVALVLWRIARLLRDRERAADALGHRAEREAALSAIGRAAVDSASPAAFVAALTLDIDRALQATSSVTPHAIDDARDPTHVVAPLGAGFGALQVRFPPDRPANEDDRRFIGTASDLAAAALRRWELEEQLRHRSLHDHLTGLPNRALVSERLRTAIDRAGTSGAPLVVLFIDLDGFKRVNDTLGHAAGDEVLGEVARRLRTEVRPGDLVGRLAGDEFVVVCQDAPTALAAMLAERVLHALAVPFELDLGEANIGASIGVACAEPGDDPEALLHRADAAMYRSKDAGKGQVTLWPGPMRATT